MFWFLIGAASGACLMYYCTKRIVQDPLTDLVFAEELRSKHEYLANYYAKAVESGKPRKKTE